MLTFIKELGMLYATPKSKLKRKYILVLCSGCSKEHKIQYGQFKAGYTEYCQLCSKLAKKGLLSDSYTRH